MASRTGGRGDLDTVTRLTTGPDLVRLRPSPAARLLGWWTPRRALAFAVAAPLVLWGLLGSPAAGQPMPLLVLVSAAAALSLASYVPLPGDSLVATLGSPCAAVGGIVPMGCAVATLVRETPGAPFLATAFVALALYQRWTGGSCGAR